MADSEATLVDTHCHIHNPSDYDISLEEVLSNSRAKRVEKMITIGVNPQDSAIAKAFAATHENVFWTFGYHPHEFDGDASRMEVELSDARKNLLVDDSKLVGIGEIGLDYHYEPYDKKAQILVLENMLQIAQDAKLPVSFHVRDAFDDFWPIFDNFKLVTSVMHSFSDSEKNLEESLRRGLYIGVNGLSTFAKIPHPPIERLLFETDSPYLTPRPFRGKINIPGNVYHIAEWATQHYDLSFDEIAKISSKNAKTVYKI